MLKIKKQRINFIVLIIVLAFLLMGTIVIVIRNERTLNIPVKNSDTVELEIPKVCEKIRKIDGRCITQDEVGVVGVMIDNHVGARPPAGLSQASLVYETIVESPITRFLAIFSLDENVEKIGPVRSARPFYVDWVKEFNGVYAHVGGSNAAIENLNATYDFNFDEFYNGAYFYRDNYRSTPHNVFTSSELIKKAIEDKKWDVKSSFESWKFHPDSLVDGNVLGIEVDFKTYDFLVRWEYDVTQKNYVRYEGHEIHSEKDGTEIRASNVVIMYTESSIIDNYGRRDTRTLGSGQALVFQNGQVIEGLWKREKLIDRTKFYNQAGEEISFYVGTTWIEVVTAETAKVKY
ncbi:MAG: hypothetical protein UT32_C0016G0013 [Parcubacteria group bacterium GW2011_GWC2_39_14]|nr:MAG: hypothetical protein UT32_C0016G0013 [Parcubacteria group bacterium GW2011_GWC2_39_14]KKR55123.1 MAG: hypothetical protein UT91_C0004G0022 [Parcubacteria group bacterium GW2011_GWA2_40_23]